MDPTQTANPQDNQQGGGFVPFGGNPPQPPVPVPPISVPLSMTDPLDAQGGMPPFHFDESEFSMPPMTPSVGISDTSVPFGGMPATIPVVVTPPVLEEQIATPAPSIEMPPMDMPSPFAPRSDLEDDKPVQTTVERQTGNEPFATTGFDLPSFDTTPTINTTNNDTGPFAMPTPEPVVSSDQSSNDSALPSFDLPAIDTTPTPVVTDTDTSFDLPSFDTTPTIANTDMTMPSFDTTPTVANTDMTMPSFDTTPTIVTSPEIVDQTPEVTMPSFDLPTTEAPAMPEATPEIPTIDMPMIESPIIETSIPSTDETPAMPTSPMPLAEDKDDDEPTTEEQPSPINEEEPQGGGFVSKSIESAISSSYTTFVDTLTRLLDLTKTETVSIVGHHTDDEHISYEFSHDETESIVIKHHDLTTDKSSDTQTLSIDHSDGLSVYLNDELLADYSDTSVTIDEQISYYINDKLSKFTLMIESEYEKLTKKTKEAEEKKKKLLADLRAF